MIIRNLKFDPENVKIKYRNHHLMVNEIKRNQLSIPAVGQLKDFDVIIIIVIIIHRFWVL